MGLVEETIVRIPNGVHIADLFIEQFPELLIVVAVFGGDEDAAFDHLGHPCLFQFLVGDVAFGGGCQVEEGWVVEQVVVMEVEVVVVGWVVVQVMMEDLVLVVV